MLSPKTQKTIIWIVVIACLAIIIYSILKVEQQFDAKYENVFTSEYEIGSDAYIMDSISYYNPLWEYQRIEDYLFISSDEYELKYRTTK